MRLAGLCAVLGISLSVAGFCLGGRWTNISITWDRGGPRVEYREASAATDGGVLEQWDATTDVVAQEGSATFTDIPPSETAYATEDGPGYAVPTGNIRKLSIKCAAVGNRSDDLSNVSIIAGDEWALQCDGNIVFTSEVDEEDGEWEITAKRKGKQYSGGALQITVPGGLLLEELELEVSACSLYVEDISCHEADISVGAGGLTLSHFSCLNDSSWEVGAGSVVLDESHLLGMVEIDCGMGSVAMSLERPESLGYEVESAMGSVTVDDAVYSGVAVAKSHGPGKDASALYFDIECGMGSVDIMFTD